MRDISEEMIKQAVIDSYQSVEVPVSTLVWLRVKARLEQIQRRKRWIKLLKIGGLAFENTYNRKERVFY